MEVVIVLLLILVIVAILVRPAVGLVIVRDFERGLRFRQGRLVGLLDTGTHVAIRPFTDIRVIDGRPTAIAVPGQEILTADGVALKVSLAARYVVADAVTATTSDQSYVAALYAALHAGLREAVAGRTADDVLADRAALGPAVSQSVASEIARLGLELLAVDVRDVMVPGELKRAFAGIVAARREGEAALERARGETAALRSLANAGRMLEDNQGLFQLRVLQQLGGSSGNTIMLGVGGSDGRPPGAASRATQPPGPGATRSPQARSVAGGATGAKAGGAASSPATAGKGSARPTTAGGVPGGAGRATGRGRGARRPSSGE